MASGWFANILQAVGEGGLSAISRYDQLHRMDEESAIRRKQEARQAEQDKLALEDRKRRQQLEEANAFQTNTAPGSVIDPMQAAILKQNPFLAGVFGEQPGTPAVAPKFNFSPAQAVSGILQKPEASFMPPPATPTPAGEAPKSLIDQPALTGSAIIQAPNVDFSTSAPPVAGAPKFDNGLFGKTALTPGTPGTPDSTVYLGNAKEQQAEHTRKRMLEIVTELQRPDITPAEQLSHIAELKVLAGPQASSFDFADLFPKATAGLQGFNLYQDTVAKKKYGPAATAAQLSPKEQIDNRSAWMAAQQRAQGIPLTLEQARNLATYDILNNSSTSFGYGASGSRENYNAAKADIIAKNVDINSLKTDYTNLVNAEKQLVMKHAMVDSYAKTLEGNIGVVLDTMEQGIKDGSMPAQNGLISMNKLLNWLELQKGNPTVASMANALRMTLYEATQISANPNLSGALSQKARDEMQEMLNFNMDTPQQLSVLGTIMKEVQNRRHGFSDMLDDIAQEKRAIETRLRGDGAFNPPSGTLDGQVLPHNSGDQPPETRIVNGVEYVNKGTKASPNWVTK